MLTRLVGEEVYYQGLNLVLGAPGIQQQIGYPKKKRSLIYANERSLVSFGTQ